MYALEICELAEHPQTSAENKRNAARRAVLKGAKIVFGQSVIDCLVLDVSESGVRVRTESIVLVPEKATVRFSGGATFSAVRRWTRGMEIGFSFESAASLDGGTAEIAWQVYEAVRATTIDEPLRLLRTCRFFDDITLQKDAEEAESALRRLELALAGRARRAVR